jgi:hypothetical protein
MKLLLTTFLAILFTNSLLSQKTGDILLVSEVTDLYAEPSIMAKSTILAINDTIKILQKENEEGYYQVSFKYGTGYINSTKISQFVKNRNSDPDYKKALERNKEITEKIKQETKEIDAYISRFWEPTSTSDFNSGDYISRTLVWNCAAGKYRSVDFEYKNSYWIKKSEYTSDCIK